MSDDKPSILSRLPPDAKLIPAKQWYAEQIDRICREGRARTIERNAKEEAEKKKLAESQKGRRRR